jgi:hypothetical protein
MLSSVNYTGWTRRDRHSVGYKWIAQPAKTAESSSSEPMRFEKLIPATLAMLEPFLVFAAIMGYIWLWRTAHPYLWMVILAFMLLSHLFRREDLATLGFARCDAALLARRFGPPLALLALLLALAGLLFHSIRQIGPGLALLSLVAYLPWGLLQQYILNGYFLNRFEPILPPAASVLLIATLFAIAHAPNTFLMPVTFVGACFSVPVYRRYRCLYLLGVGHGIIGFLLFLVVPDSISHHLRVGPGWFRP